jgi:hypothetical protein
MFKKSIAFGLLAAGLMIAPTAAFAGNANQSQDNQQGTVQNGAATNGSTSAQESNSVSVQRQISNIKNRSHVGVYPHNAYTSQDQNSVQDSSQNGAADNGSTNAQSNSTVNHQSQLTGIHNRKH